MFEWVQVYLFNLLKLLYYFFILKLDMLNEWTKWTSEGITNEVSNTTCSSSSVTSDSSVILNQFQKLFPKQIQVLFFYFLMLNLTSSTGFLEYTVFWNMTFCKSI